MGMWSCPGCGILNNGEVRYCVRCGNVRPDERTSAGTKKANGAVAFAGVFFLAVALVVSIILDVSTRPWANIATAAVEDVSLSESSVPSQPLSYEKGAVVDGVYTNRWANLEFDVPDAFPEADSYVYDVYNATGQGAEYGFVSQNLISGRSYLVFFEPVSDGVTDVEYMDAFIESYIYGVELAGSTVDVYEYYYGVLAGDDYLVCCANVKENGVWEYICVRIYDGYAIAVVASSTDENEVIDTLNSIRSPKA